MTDKLIIAAPLFDEVTEISLDWAKWTMQRVEEFAFLVKCYDEFAVKDTVIAHVRSEPKAKWFVHYDHGGEFVLWGDDQQPIINLENLHELAGMHAYNMNCLSGKGLGAHAVDAGILEFLGYSEAYAFTNDSLTENRNATAFGLIQAMKNGLELKNVVESMRENGYRIAKELRESGRWLAAAALVRNMNSLICYYPGGPPPPDPGCPVSRLIKWMGGWRALGFLRMLRQRLFPERYTFKFRRL